MSAESPSLSANADEWLSGLEETYASPNRECSQEDVDEHGNREGNTCLEATQDDLEFPDDWCDRCYVLYVTRQARAALRGNELDRAGVAPSPPHLGVAETKG